MKGPVLYDEKVLGEIQNSANDCNIILYCDGIIDYTK